MRFTQQVKPYLLVFAVLANLCSAKAQSTQNTTWEVYGGSKKFIRYSALKQVNTKNVKQLQVAWTYHTEDADARGGSQIQCNPIIVDGVLYGTTPRLSLVALNASTGVLKWKFNAEDQLAKKENLGINNNRGVTYWQSGADKRILYCAGSNLYAVNAQTGRLVKSFGKDGAIDLHDNLELNNKNWYVAGTTPGIIYRDLYILGSRVNESANAAPGSVRAFDVRTGKLRWIFHTIPHPGEFGYNTWEDKDAWKYIGGANCWAGFSMDEKRGIIYAPTGSASFDFYGGKRKGKGLFANSLLALDAATGKLKWHYQVIHHDLWDKDLPTAPALVTIRRNGKLIDAVAQPTKHGFLFILDRVTGKSLYPVKEKPVPTTSELDGEKVWPTQPFPTLPEPFVRQNFTEKDINPYISEQSKVEVLGRLKSYRYGNMFLPPGKQPSVIFPGFDGGPEWGGPAYDPQTGLLYINANEVPWILTMIDAPKAPGKVESFATAGERLFAKNCMSCHGQNREGSGNNPTLIGIEKKYTAEQIMGLLETGRRMMPAFKELGKQEREAVIAFVTSNQKEGERKFTSPAPLDPYLDLPYQMTGYNKFLTKEGLPAISPPWGTLNAINLNTGKIAWKIPLGEDENLSKQGYPITGTENYGGPVVTAGGLVFIAATRDEKIRAFDKRNGKLLWEAKLPAAGFATPSIYQVHGKKYLIIACGGGKLGTRSGDAYVAFAIPGTKDN
ncbi:PQQ-binding-like beta-propeller repeat protein [Mucilaginibacter antarcticus]|uniref:PQQ-binding-like beta-propeller repeat protein n=2 Tax=Mucilaginibacter antarcticus TaxID=1855725 RepID=A0ABW5XSE0_9SPHI